ncbi:hypothetical protein GW17_00045460 [Ensete ventricosum]|nr:hypothetical protein GW17_00045460 [Ensete ventricosum]
MVFWSIFVLLGVIIPTTSHFILSYVSTHCVYDVVWSYSRPDTGKVGTPTCKRTPHCKDDKHGGGYGGMVSHKCGKTRRLNASTRHAIVEELARFGAAVHTCSRNEAELKECLQQWRALNLKVTGSVCDVSSPVERDKLMETASSIFHGKLHVLVRLSAVKC